MSHRRSISEQIEEAFGKIFQEAFIAHRGSPPVKVLFESVAYFDEVKPPRVSMAFSSPLDEKPIIAALRAVASVLRQGSPALPMSHTLGYHEKSRKKITSITILCPSSDVLRNGTPTLQITPPEYFTKLCSPEIIDAAISALPASFKAVDRLGHYRLAERMQQPGSTPFPGV